LLIVKKFYHLSTGKCKNNDRGRREKGKVTLQEPEGRVESKGIVTTFQVSVQFKEGTEEPKAKGSRDSKWGKMPSLKE
jgi:hypothetical protein